MKLISAFVSLAFTRLGLVLAQIPDGLPQCAQPCVTQLTSGDAIGGCNQFDVECICSNESFLDNIACCLADECSPDEQDAAVDYARNLCAGFGVTNLPDEVTCTASAATSSESVTTSTTTSESVTVSPTSETTSDSGADGSGESETTGQSNETDNAGPLVTMAPAGVLGGVIAAVAML